VATAAAASPGAGSVAPLPRGARRSILKWIAGLVGLAILVVAPLVGPVAIPPDLIGRILLYGVTFGHYPSTACAGIAVVPRLCDAYQTILWQERLPEILLALLAGAALGISGATLQGVFRNPLADPYLLGLSTGGTLGAATLLIFKIGLADSDLLLPLFAFLGAFLTGVAILAAARGSQGSVETLLLTGVALASFLSAVLSIVLLYNPLGSLQVSYWLLGGLGGATWDRDGIVAGGLLVGASLLVLEGRRLNVLQLGPEVAQSLGVDVPRTRVRLLLLASLVTATAVAFTGVIGFVGLVSAHVVRRLAGVDYRKVLPGAALVGGLFLLAARNLADGALPGTILPVGIFTSFAGAPFFLYLLYRRRGLSGIGGA
jgi:iron complex transport system permease protein